MRPVVPARRARFHRTCVSWVNPVSGLGQEQPPRFPAPDRRASALVRASVISPALN
jgi:hypothetical protein